ncbi:MAG: cyclase family protein [Flavobacteriales bacterium]|jgi:arylformamidase
MKVLIEHNDKTLVALLDEPLDISIPLSPDGPRAWYVDRMNIRPVQGDGFIGDIAQGGSVNFRNIQFNPHGHGTHTESYEHVAAVQRPIGTLLSKYFFTAQLMTLTPSQVGEDRIITKNQVEQQLENSVQALVIRTLPNTEEKLNKDYSNTNFPYFEEEALMYLADKNIQHLLVDLPSVDREHDEGKLAAHKAFWKNGDTSRHQCTITEFVFVKNTISDDLYLLELQVAPFVNDAAPSRPVLYPLVEVK